MEKSINQLNISIDGRSIQTEENKTILQIAWDNKVYIPFLCAHPDLSSSPNLSCNPDILSSSDLSYSHVISCKHDSSLSPDILCSPDKRCLNPCNFCLVECSGQDELVLACKTLPKDKMTITTNSKLVEEARKSELSRLLATHPHICLTCPHRDGCDRIDCTLGIPIVERCCERFGECEVQQVADYIGIPDETPPYKYSNLNIWNDDPVISLDLNRCIGCQRCVLVCKTIMNYNILAPFQTNQGILVSPKAAQNRNAASGFKLSGCKFCGACVEICPAGAILEQGPHGKRWRQKTKSKLNLIPVPLPPKSTLPFTSTILQTIPDAPGIYRLWDKEGKLFLIEGTPSLKNSIKEELEKQDRISEICEIDFEESQLYTSRVNELLAVYLKEHGSLPKGNDVTDDLF